MDERPSPESRGDGPRSCVPADLRRRRARDRIRWLWPRRVPLGAHHDAGRPPGEGKSFLTTDMAGSRHAGPAWPDGSDCRRRPVLVISAEDDPRDTIRRPPWRGPRARTSKRVHLLSMVGVPDSDGREYETMFTLADVEALDAALRRRIPTAAWS